MMMMTSRCECVSEQFKSEDDTVEIVGLYT